MLRRCSARGCYCSRQNVGQRDQRPIARPMLAVVPALRQTQGKWNVRRRFVEKALGAGVVIAQVFAVIGGIDDKGIVENAHVLQSGEDAAHIVVDLGDDAIIGSARGADDFRRHEIKRLLLSRQANA